MLQLICVKENIVISPYHKGKKRRRKGEASVSPFKPNKINNDMKYITIVYAAIIVIILCIAALIVQIITFPICIMEMFTEDGRKHNFWIVLNISYFKCVSEVYKEITEGETE